MLRFGLLFAAFSTWLAVGLLLVPARRLVAGTTLTSAWVWGMVAWLGWGLLLSCDAARSSDSIRPLSYLAAVLLLCPSLAVLGAKRPMSRVWSAFVIAPLLLVLGWSALAVLLRVGGQPVDWQLDDPVTVGFVLIVVMTAGNHLASRFVLAELLFLLGLTLTVVPLTSAGSRLPSVSPLATHAVSTLCFAIAAASAWWTATHPPQAGLPLDRLWFDFRHWFGLLWARRVQERMNQAAQQFNWPVRLELEGFVPRKQRPAGATVAEHPGLNSDPPPDPEQSLIWLLRRFADAEWVSSRLGKNAGGRIRN